MGDSEVGHRRLDYHGTGVHRYSGLVVHDPVTAMLPADLGRSNGVNGPGRLSFRARSPFFCGDTLHRRGGPMGRPGRVDGPWGILGARSAGRGGGVGWLIRRWALRAGQGAAILSGAYE